MHEHVRVLKRRIITTLLCLGLVVGVGAAVISSLIDTIDVRHQQVAYQAAERMAAAELLASAQQERSSSARGYLLTGDPAFLERRRSARQEFAAELDRLGRLGGDEPQLARLRELVTRLGESSDRALALWPQDSASAVRLWDQEARPIQERVAGELHAYVSSARASFAGARAAAAIAATDSRRLSVGLGLVMLSVLIGLFLQFARTTRELLQRVRGEQEQVTFRLLDQVPFGIFVLDSRGAPYYANRSAERLLGSSLQLRAKAENMSQVYRAYEAGTDHLYPPERMPIARALAGESSEVSDMELRREDQVIPLLVQGCPVYDQGGKLTHAVAAFQDVRELTRKALVDALTGLSNRAALAQIFGRERLLSERSHRGLGVCIIDLDHFKSVNDLHGHVAGDRVLQRVARTLAEALRRTDVVGRWGGEEFVVLLPSSDHHGLRTVLEKALAAVRRESFQGRDRAAFQVTFSAGAVLAHSGESLESSVARADALLYAAKRAGRNRILVEPTPSVPPASAA
jgi:diguanylate cyclase (GGDEF)-like protein